MEPRPWWTSFDSLERSELSVLISPRKPYYQIFLIGILFHQVVKARRFEVRKCKTRRNSAPHQSEPAAFVEKTSLPAVPGYRYLHTLAVQNVLPQSDNFTAPTRMELKHCYWVAQVNISSLVNLCSAENVSGVRR
jgi:hypothetical protein